MTTDNETVLWTCNQDAEYLRHDNEHDAIEERLDDLEELPSQIMVYGFQRNVVDRKIFLNVVLEQAGEHLDEEYGGEDGHDINDEIQKAAESFVDTYIKNYKVWRCEESESKQVNVKEWVAKNRPDWLTQVKFVEASNG